MFTLLFLQAAYSGSCSIYDLLFPLLKQDPFCTYYCTHCLVTSEVFPSGTTLSSLSGLLSVTSHLFRGFASHACIDECESED